MDFRHGLSKIRNELFGNAEQQHLLPLKQTASSTERFSESSTVPAASSTLSKSTNLAHHNSGLLTSRSSSSSSTSVWSVLDEKLDRIMEEDLPVKVVVEPVSQEVRRALAVRKTSDVDQANPSVSLSNNSLTGLKDNRGNFSTGFFGIPGADLAPEDREKTSELTLASTSGTASHTSISSSSNKSSSRTSVLSSVFSTMPLDVHERARDPTCFMQGGKPVDLVLAYHDISVREKHSLAALQAKIYKKYRAIFEAKLIEVGFDIELETHTCTFQTCFIKIHAPWDLLAKLAEFMHVKVPIAVIDNERWAKALTQKTIRKCCPRIWPCLHIPEKDSPEEMYYYKTAFDRYRMDMYLVQNRDMTFQPAERIRIVWNFLKNMCIDKLKATALTRKYPAANELLCEEGQYNQATIDWLLHYKVYDAAYPLHDSEFEYVSSDDPFYDVQNKHLPQRYWLYKYWANWRAMRFFQPLEHINRYLGSNCALYFAWLGMYTKWLVVPALLGLSFTIFAAYDMATDELFFRTACNYTNKDAVVCRLCKSVMCPFKYMFEDCLYGRLAHMQENITTTVYAIFMCVWSCLFLTMWKRRQLQLSVRWDAREGEYNEEAPRAEYTQTVRSMRTNPVTGKSEIHMQSVEKRRRVAVSIVAVFFYINLVLVFLAAVQAYRILSAAFYKRTVALNWHHLGLDMSLVTSIVASVLTGVTIFILSHLYKKAAVWLTHFECPRTDSDYLISYSYKVFMFQFANNYSTLFYLAILKGKFNESMLKVKEEVDFCPIVGCMPQVTIQLLFIFTARQVMNNLLEVVVPFLKHKWRRFRIKVTPDRPPTRAACDYLLSPVSTPEFFEDYLEMVIQFGYITMFAAAFPLGPLFALLNNLVEIRVDANKIITERRRICPKHVQNIGPWLGVLDVLGKLSIFTNALIIAFTSDQIDRLVYSVALPVLPRFKDLGFLGYSLTEYNVTDIYGTDEPELLHNPLTNKSTCIYRGYYHDYDDPPELVYTRRPAWYIVMVGRLTFVIIFENVLLLVAALIKHWLPKMTKEIKQHIKREQSLSQEKRAQYAWTAPAADQSE